MPEQFPYPEKGWSTGNMRTARRAMPADPGYPIRELEGERKRRETKVSQAAAYPQLSPEELAAWAGGMPPGDKTYGFDRHQRWDPNEADPHGAVIAKDHPQINEVGATHDIYTIPDESQPKSRPGFEWLFVKPKPQGPPVS